MAKQVEHYGLTERVLHTGRNFAREQEQLVQVTGGHSQERAHVEGVIGVGQQITNIINSKNLSGPDKVARLLNSALNPFIDHNFSEE